MGEVILFRAPTDDTSLFVCNISPTTTEELLQRVFGKFGLIHDVHIARAQTDALPSQLAPSIVASITYYGFVNFYSVLEAKAALQSLNGKKLKEGDALPCKISFAKRKERVQQLYNLSINNCFRLANHFLGFEQWSSQVINLTQSKFALATEEQLKEQKVSSRGAHFSCMYHAVVRITLKDGRFVEGVGTAEAISPNKGDALHYAKKKAVSNATKQAFALMAIVVLEPSRKVAIHFMESGTDHWIHPD